MDTSMPPLDGTLLTVSDFVDFHAKQNADKPWLMFLAKGNPEELVSISYHEMAQASHRIAHRMRPTREGPDGEVVTLLINTDSVIYVAVVLGLIRAGYVPYPMSPRNSPQAMCHMLEAVSSTRIIAHGPTAALFQQVQSEMQAKGTKLRLDELPGLLEVFPQFGENSAAAAKVKPYPPSDRPIDMHMSALYFHSSGSTGYPKSVDFTHRRMLQWFGSTSTYWSITWWLNPLYRISWQGW